MTSYGGGGTQVTYQAPAPDNTNSLLLQYIKEKDAAAETKAAEQAQREAEKEAARLEGGKAGYESLKTNLQNQLTQGLIDYEEATTELRDYGKEYDIFDAEKDVQSLTDYYTTNLLPGRRETGAKSAYQEILGREATEEELSSTIEKFNTGYYSSIDDLKDTLYKGSEYQDKYNQSYLDNYYDTKFGKQTVDESGKKTGKRTFTFSAGLLPTYKGSEDLALKTGITMPDYGESFTGTAAEIEEQLQSVRDSRQFLYSAGLTNLQGQIDQETQKLKNEGAKEVKKIESFGNVAASLVSGFWS
jgi:hypothetical protein